MPQIFADIDRDKVQTLGIQISDVFSTMQAILGSAYVNDFNLFGRTFLGLQLGALALQTFAVAVTVRIILRRLGNAQSHFRQIQGRQAG